MKRPALVLFAVVCGGAFSACGVAQAQNGKEAKGTQVVFATRDLAAGEVVTFDDLTKGVLPDDWPMGSAVTPFTVSYIVNQRVNVPVMKGDVLRWFVFETAPSEQEAVDRCRQVSAPAATAAEQVARSRQVILSRKPH